MSTIYLAGPMRGIPEFNFPAFFHAEELLRQKGHTVINPARHDVELGFRWHGLTGNEDLSEHNFDLHTTLAWDLAQVLTADQVALLPGWQQSAGARAEVAAAEAVGTLCVVLSRFTDTSVGDIAVAHSVWNVFNSKTLTVTCATCGERVPYTPSDPNTRYDELACDEALLRHAVRLVERATLMKAADALEGALGLPGTPKTLYDFRSWLRKRANA